MNTAHSNPANKATAYRVARRTERANRIAEQWADSLGRYWESFEGSGNRASVHWLKIEGQPGWWLLNDAAYFAVQHVADETAEAKGEGELLGWDVDEIAAWEEDGQSEPFVPDLGEPVGLLPVLEAIRGLNGPCWYEGREAA